MVRYGADRAGEGREEGEGYGPPAHTTTGRGPQTPEAAGEPRAQADRRGWRKRELCAPAPARKEIKRNEKVWHEFRISRDEFEHVQVVAEH